MLRFTLLIILLFPVPVHAGQLRVFTSVLPLQTFVEFIGGKNVIVHSMVRSGYSPHTYEPTPQQIRALAQADLYIRTGLPFEHAWMKRINASNPAIQILDAHDGLKLRKVEEHVGHGHQHKHNHNDESGYVSDPHVWTSPPLVGHMAGAIRDRLIEMDPAHSTEYSGNHDRLIQELQELDKYIHNLLASLKNRKFMVFHPSWGYFANTYGLIQKPIEYAGKQPGAKALVALIEQAKQEKVRVIFVQPQFDRRKAALIARSIGGGVVAVDPLASDYFNNMRSVAQQFAMALK